MPKGKLTPQVLALTLAAGVRCANFRFATGGPLRSKIGDFLSVLTRSSPSAPRKLGEGDQGGEGRRCL